MGVWERGAASLPQTDCKAKRFFLKPMEKSMTALEHNKQTVIAFIARAVNDNLGIEAGRE